MTQPNTGKTYYLVMAYNVWWGLDMMAALGMAADYKKEDVGDGWAPVFKSYDDAEKRYPNALIVPVRQTRAVDDPELAAHRHVFDDPTGYDG
jgi:hypothetical protein